MTGRAWDARQPDSVGVDRYGAVMSNNHPTSRLDGSDHDQRSIAIRMLTEMSSGTVHDGPADGCPACGTSSASRDVEEVLAA